MPVMATLPRAHNSTGVAEVESKDARVTDPAQIASDQVINVWQRSQHLALLLRGTMCTLSKNE